MLIDADPGIDDIMAISYALKSEKVKLEGVTTVAGNTHIGNATKNALKVLEIINKGYVPVARGISKPILRELKTATDVHGEDRFGNLNLTPPKMKESDTHAVDFIIKTIMDNPKKIVLVSLGPLTNIAVALLIEPRLTKYVKEMVIMGGAIKVRGNVTPDAEFNIFTDPEAAKLVFHSGMPITLVGLDVTMNTVLTPDNLAEIEGAGTPISLLIGQISRYYMKFYEVRRIDGCAMHDPPAVGVAIDKTLVKMEKAYVSVETKGELTLGKTVANFDRSDRKHPVNMEVCLGVDSDRFIQTLIDALKRVSQPH